MKMNWSITWLAFLCLFLLSPILEGFNRTSSLASQNSRAKKTVPLAKQPKKTSSAATTTRAKTAAPSPKAEPVNRPNPGAEDGRNPEAQEQLLAAKKERKDRIDEALHRAQQTLTNSSDLELKEKLKQLTSDGKTLEHELDKSANQDELKSLDTRVEQVEAEADAIVEAANPSAGSFTLNNILLYVTLLLTLLSLGGLTYMFLTFQTRLDQLTLAQLKSQRAAQELRELLHGNKEYVERLDANLSRVAEDLGLKIESAKRNSEEAKKLARAREAQPNNLEPLRAEQGLDFVAPEPTFPSLVADYLSRLRPNQPTAVEADFRTNLLVAAAPEDAPFFFIENSDGSGAGIVLPKPRLQRSQEFSSYYKGYYHCSDPSAGEVYIIEPALVCPDGKGWRLSQKGRMEIR